ncbi:MAG: FGGY-family carbohydrate kinase [Candidatus Latescibacteria bacterium]|nr:FGGY-family carbohydrate kinase [Candidatus Latescibacterota bacterium]
MDEYANQVLLGIDLGATGIKAAVFGLDGKLIASASRRNGPVRQPGGREGWLIWDADDIWNKVCQCTREVIEQLKSPSQIGGVSVSGFGVDGAPVDRDGKLLYPLSSWHDTRNLSETEWLTEQIEPYEIYEITGFHNYSIQTINRLRWLAVHEPDVLKKAHCYLMTQDFLVNRLSGEFTTEITMASTTTALDIDEDRWSDRMLDTIGVSRNIFPKISQSGHNIGEVTKSASEQSGIPAGTPVATGGHDCEIGALGAGVTDPETFVDITGTWEMIIAILDTFTPNRALFDAGIDWERHCLPNQYLCQSLMIAGGVLEWIGTQFYRDTDSQTLYSTMISEAGTYGPGAGGTAVLPSFIRGMGPFQAYNSIGTILGITTTTTRGQIVRAVFESTCYQLARQIKVIEDNTGAVCKRLRTLGGAQKNEFWLQMKADVTGKPVEIIDNPEVTLLGAAILAGIGSGVYSDEQDALSGMSFPVHVYEPDKNSHDEYRNWYERIFAGIAPGLKSVYAAF